MRKRPQITKYNKKLIFGIGSGRCGTKSLAYLLNAQENANISHELGGRPFLPWKFNINKLNQAMKEIISRKSNICGDVAFYWLPYMNYIINNYKDVHIIIIKRDREETLQSYLRWTSIHDYWYPEKQWNSSYPDHKMKYKNKENFFKYFWETYYNKTNLLLKKYNKSYEIKTNDLNNRNKMKHIFVNKIGMKHFRHIYVQKNRTN
ncbi:MAG: hypothetical protein ACOC56_03775 [Atribacterota bacterium]